MNRPFASRRLLSQSLTFLSRKVPGTGVFLALALAHWIGAVGLLASFHSPPERLVREAEKQAATRRAAALNVVRNAIRAQNWSYPSLGEHSLEEYTGALSAILEALPDAAVPGDLASEAYAAEYGTEASAEHRETASRVDSRTVLVLTNAHKLASTERKPVRERRADIDPAYEQFKHDRSRGRSATRFEGRQQGAGDSRVTLRLD